MVVALVMTPLGAKAADLVVWWEKGFTVEEDEAVRELIGAFEQGSGKEVELSFYPQAQLPDEIEAALETGTPPDFAFGLDASSYVAQWAFDDRLVDLSDAIGSFANMFDVEALASAVLVNGKLGHEALYALPMGQATTLIHVWKSLLDQAGFTLADVPKEWEAFWAFWCDQVQPAVRHATGRDDVWGVGLLMSADAFDAVDAFFQFVAAYEADYVTQDGRLVIDDAEIRPKLIKAIASYTAIYHEGCTPPDSTSWTNIDNNERFHAQTVVMTPNLTLSVPNALRRERPDDYYENVATIEWPLGPSGKSFPIVGLVFSAVAFKHGSNVAAAEDFVRFLVREGWLAHYLNFSAERMLPPLPGLLNQPFWLDPGDPHRMAAVMQVASRPLMYSYVVASGDWRHDRVRSQENVWGKAVHRVAAEGITPEQAVDEAIARIKQILSE
ncbi:MAG TPA: ABC transporter substrate-binding protein [Geminicoccaceae bacterium]|nr:ABC transporter substrate-binding protein [Geminicoccaceae bacterium]